MKESKNMNSVTISDIINKATDIIRLPKVVNRAEDYFTELYRYLDLYQKFIYSEPELKPCTETSDYICNEIKRIESLYFSGEYDETNQCIRKIIRKLLAIEQQHFICSLDDLYNDYEKSHWFRMRTGTYYNYTKEELKHIPASKRKNVENFRYSVNGVPCLYLGHSIIGCWEEYKRKKLDELWVSRFWPVRPLKLFNISTTANELRYADMYLRYAKNEDGLAQAAIEFFSIWPLQCACSMIIEEQDRIFKEEYVIPQLLMMNLKQFNIHGIMYFCTRQENVYLTDISWLFKNIAIPAFDLSKETMYSPFIEESFAVSQPMNIGMFNAGITPAKYEINILQSNSARTDPKVYIGNVGYCYSDTVFFRAENELLQEYYGLRDEVRNKKLKSIEE